MVSARLFVCACVYYKVGIKGKGYFYGGRSVPTSYFYGGSTVMLTIEFFLSYASFAIFENII